MKIQLEVYADETNFFIEAETALENIPIMKAVRKIRKPARAFGAIRDTTGLAWAWINFPNRKNISTYEILSFDDDNKST